MGVYYAFINLKIGDSEWIADSEAIMQINHMRSTKLSGNVVIEVYDSTAVEVETKLLMQESREFEYWYGYQGGVESEHYKAIATKITPQFTGEGITLTIEGVMTSSYKSMYETEGKLYTGTPSAIVKQIASEEGWVIGTIVETKDPGGSSNNEQLDTFQAYREAHQSAEQFINDKIKPISESEEGEGNYQLVLRDESGSIVVSYYPAGHVDSGEGYLYVVGGAPNEEIISFEPQYGEFLYALMGSNGGESGYKETLSNEDVRVSTVVGNTADVTNAALGNLPTAIVGKANSASREQQEILSRNTIDKLYAQSYQATLVIKGKPNVPVGENIDIKVFSKDGVAHFSSGKYMIMSAEDLIDGAFTTTLTLMRAELAQKTSDFNVNGATENLVKGRKIGDFYVRALFDVSVVSSDMTGSSDEEKVWNFLNGKIQNSLGTAALMGNLYAESGIKSKCVQGDYTHENPTQYDEEYTAKVDSSYSESDFYNDKTGGGGYGLAQWTYWSRKRDLYRYAKSCSKSIGDLQMQLEFLWKELTGDGTSCSYVGVKNALVGATDLREATVKVLTDFENPAKQDESVKKLRLSYAQTYYDRYSGSKNSGASTKTVIVTDPKEIAVGNKVFINNNIYESKSISGKSVSGKNIDIYFGSESEKNAWTNGVYEVYEAVKQEINPVNVSGPDDGSIPESEYYSACKPYLGWPYVWGGESEEEGGYDCSGFVYALFKGLGYNWSRETADNQAKHGTPVPVEGPGLGLDRAKPGDLLFNATNGNIKHVMCYLGNGWMVHAPKQGDVVRTAKVYTRPYCIRRLL